MHTLKRSKREFAERAIEHMIKLMVIFLLQTLLITMLLMWALYGLARGAFQLPQGAKG